MGYVATTTVDERGAQRKGDGSSGTSVREHKVWSFVCDFKVSYVAKDN